jgi:hypothetical protein
VPSGSVRAIPADLAGGEQTIHVKHPGGTLAGIAVFDGGVLSLYHRRGRRIRGALSCERRCAPLHAPNDRHTVNTFHSENREFLEEFAAMVGQLMASFAADDLPEKWERYHEPECKSPFAQR